MQKSLYILITIAVLGIIAVYTVPKINHLANVPPDNAVSVTTSPTPVPTKTSITSTVAASATPTPTASTGLNDGTYTGSSSSNRYGTVQVAINVLGGQITNVDFLQMPDADSRSVSISSYAQPLLEQTTLSAQSANIDTISGATYTSNCYINSLQSAIDQAKA